MMNGYRLIYNPSHSKAMSDKCGYKGYVYEHVLVAEEFIGRELLPNEVVHHLDGDKSNNRIENLLVLDRGQHTKLHIWLKSVTDSKVSDDNGMKSVKTKYCEICGRTLQCKRQRWCSDACMNSALFKRPSRETLIDDVSKHLSKSAIGRKYGVSHTTVSRWFSHYKLTPSQAESTLSDGVETSGEVKSS